ncbi:hypothetical protein FRC10_003218 [Ceratobasidium sp. 414]|nr:hypothetical protein FRC10_003218 [Ceratobasidium sp. 414]
MVDIVATKPAYSALGQDDGQTSGASSHSPALQPRSQAVSPEKLNQLDLLAGSPYARFVQIGELADLNEAIKCYAELVELTPERFSGMHMLLNNFAVMLETRFEQLGDPVDLDGAIERQTEAILLTPNGHSDRPGRLNRLGLALRTRFEQSGTPEDMDASIEHLIEAVLLTSNGCPEKNTYLSNLGESFHCRFNELGDFAYLDAAIECYTEATLHAPEKHPDKPVALMNCGSLLHTRFERLGILLDLDATIENWTEAAMLMPDGHPNRHTLLHRLGGSLFVRFQRVGELADLDAAIERETEVVLLTPDGHPQKPELLSDLGISFHTRFMWLGGLIDLEAAIERQTEAVLLTPDGHTDKPERLSNLGCSLHTKFGRLGRVTDSDAAIQCHTEAVRLTPGGHPARPSCLSNFGSALRTRFRQLGELTDLNAAIEHQVEAVLLAPDGHPGKPSFLNELGASSQARFQILGELADLDLAIQRHTEAALLTPIQHSEKPRRLINLGNSLATRFGRLGELTDLDAAIRHQTEALLLMHEKHPNKRPSLINIGGLLLARFERLGELTDLDVSIQRQTEALMLTPDGHTDKFICLNNLGSSFRTRFKRLGELTDLEIAIERQTKAKLLTPAKHPLEPEVLSKLGLLHVDRFERLGKLADLKAGVEHQTEAVLLTPDGHADKPTHLGNLGKAHMVQFRVLKDEADLVISLQHLKRAGTSLDGAPSRKMAPLLLWARAACLYRRPDILEAYSHIVELIPQIAWLGSTVNRRYEHMATLATESTEAVTVAIDLKRFDLALEWLEQGRSVVWSQMLQLRTPVDDLRIVDATLANSLEEVARQLESSGSLKHAQVNLESQTSIEHTAREHHGLALMWDKLVGQARQLSGFERFLLPKKLSELSGSTYTKTVVVINVHEARCDALALRSGLSGGVHIPLPSLSRSQCVDMRNQLLTALRGSDIRARQSRRPVFDGPEAENMFESVLAALWVDVVRPILDALGYLIRPTEASGLPCVAWCTTGPLAFLPLHAAGFYNQPCERVFDYIVSSYTPTLSALLKPLPPSTEFHGILAVGQAAQAAHTPLPGTITELDNIQEQAARLPFTRLAEENATPVAVLAAMKKHSWVHLACHASQDVLDPSTSAFQLCGGQLNLATITREPLPNAELAFLSACETATGSGRVPDEAAHLAAGMLMSGYRTVIATMWSIRDADAPIVSEYFYSQLLENGVPHSGKAARALHDAVGHLRTRIGEKEFLRWVPYIHIGR